MFVLPWSIEPNEVWTISTFLNNQVMRDYLTGQEFANLMTSRGISRDSTVVIYGDKHNWWAAYIRNNPEEYTGERTSIPDYPQEGVLRGGKL
jgi:3-mercaptopyruvate sulfurtransferase SseA